MGCFNQNQWFFDPATMHEIVWLTLCETSWQINVMKLPSLKIHMFTCLESDSNTLFSWHAHTQAPANTDVAV